MYRDARFAGQGARQLEESTLVARITGESTAPSWHAQAGRLKISRLRVDQGDTFSNRFLLVWHEREDCFRDLAYRSFWQAFAREACNDGPRVDDTLHLSPLADGRRAEFWVIGGDGRLASHCANGLMYAALRYSEMREVASVTFRCGRTDRCVSVRGGSAQVNLGRPRPLPAIGRFPARLQRSPVLVHTGEPHAVSFDEDVAVRFDEDVAVGFDEDVARWDRRQTSTFVELGQAVCRTGAPAGINWNLITRHDGGLRIRTFERGVRRPTSSCGTGSAAAFYAAQISGRYDCDELAITSEGGCHVVCRHNEEILVTGKPSHRQSWTLGNYLSAAL
jgi:diaminopimelate epimerase